MNTVVAESTTVNNLPRLEQLEARVRETPLIDRLKDARSRIAKMCTQGRPPRMSIPVQYDDDDFFINITLKDAIEALSQQ